MGVWTLTEITEVKSETMFFSTNEAMYWEKDSIRIKRQLKICREHFKPGMDLDKSFL